MRPRSVGRRLALQYLFMADMNHFSGVETPGEFFRIQRDASRDNEPGGEADGFVFDKDDSYRDEAEAFAKTIIDAVEKDRETIDAVIEKTAKNWSIVRMGVIERNVIRIAAAELLAGESPRGVILDEAVNLAKRFGDNESGVFVNGIADQIRFPERCPGKK